MINKSIHQLIMLPLLSILLIFISSNITSAENEIIEVNPIIGLEENYQFDQWTPLVLVVNNFQPIEGHLKLSISTEEEVAIWEQLIDISNPIITEKIYQTTIPPIISDNFTPDSSLYLRLEFPANTDIYAQQYLLEQNQTANTLVISESGTGFNFINTAEDEHTIAYLKPTILPTNWLGYSGVSTIIVDDADINLLSSPQKQAIYQWVSLGGTVIFTSRRRQTTFNSQLLEMLLPINVTGRQQMQITSQNEKSEIISLFDNLHLNLWRVNPINGNVLASSDNIPLLLNQSIDSGTVFFLPFDPRNYSLANWPSKIDFFNILVNNEYLPTSKLYGLFDHLSNQMLLAINIWSPSRILILLIVFLFCYLINIIYSSSYKGNRKILFILGLTAFSLIIIATTLGQLFNNNNKVFSQVAIIHKMPYSEKAFVDSYATYFQTSGSRPIIKLATEHGVLNNYKQEVNPRLRENLENILSQQESLINFSQEQPWLHGGFRANFTTTLPIYITNKPDISLQINNLSSLDIERAFLFVDNKWHAFESIPSPQDDINLSYQELRSYTDFPRQTIPRRTWYNPEFSRRITSNVLTTLAAEAQRIHPETPFVLLQLNGTSFATGPVIEPWANKSISGFAIIPFVSEDEKELWE